ncbi:MAG: hypothetical protein LH610_00860 [Sphingomonas bacterium]|nr:hypothetical protein [Sphingomonas bacterium]
MPGELRLSYLYAGPTELQLILIALTLTMLISGRQIHILWQLNGFDLFVAGVGLLLIALFVVRTIRIARRLTEEEPSADHCRE